MPDESALEISLRVSPSQTGELLDVAITGAFGSDKVKVPVAVSDVQPLSVTFSCV